jgi:peptide/nickel transport system substrate-binding protein
MFKVQLDAPDSTFLTTLAWPSMAVVPKEVVEERGADFGNNPVGSGAFKFIEWVKDDHVTLEAFEDYYAGRPYLDKAIFRSVPEKSTVEAEFLAGNLDAFIATTSIYRKYKDDPQYEDQLLTVAEYFTRNIGFNTTKEPFTDKRVRQAFNYAIDKEAILKHVLDGKGFLAAGWLPSSNWAFDPGFKGYEFDADKAKALMAETDFAGGVEVPIVTTEHPEWGLPIVEAVMPYLDEVGITLKPEVMTGGVMNERIIQGDYTAYIWSNGGDAHPVAFMYRWHSTRQEITNRYANPEVDELLERAKQSTDRDEIIDLVRQVDSIVVEDAPMWPFHYNMAVTMFQPWVHGVNQFPVDMAMQDLSTVWLDPDHRGE